MAERTLLLASFESIRTLSASITPSCYLEEGNLEYEILRSKNFQSNFKSITSEKEKEITKKMNEKRWREFWRPKGSQAANIDQRELSTIVASNNLQPGTSSSLIHVSRISRRPDRRRC